MKFFRGGLLPNRDPKIKQTSQYQTDVPIANRLPNSKQKFLIPNKKPNSKLKSQFQTEITITKKKSTTKQFYLRFYNFLLYFWPPAKSWVVAGDRRIAPASPATDHNFSYINIDFILTPIQYTYLC